MAATADVSEKLAEMEISNQPQAWKNLILIEIFKKEKYLFILPCSHEVFARFPSIWILYEHLVY